MKNQIFKIALFFALLGIFAVGARAQAAETKTIHFKVAALEQILYEGDFTVQFCPNDNASSTNLTVNAWCAVWQLAENQNWNATSTWGFFGVFLNSIENYDGSDGNYWFWFSNSEPGETALNQHILQEGEKLLLTYGIAPLKISADNLSPQINASSTISAQYFDAMNWQWSGAASSTFLVNGQEIFDEDGVLDIWTSTTTPYNVFAKKDGFLQSEPIAITPQLPSVQIKLKIETATSTVFNQNMAVQACPVQEDGLIYSVNGRCALEQSGLAAAWSSWGNDVFLDAVENYQNNAGGNGIYWLWFQNLEYGQTALNKHLLSEGEELLLVYGINPLKLIVSTTTPYLNSTTTLSLREFGFDESWNSAWLNSASSTLFINGETFFSADGTYDLFISTTTPYSIFGRKAGFLDSVPIVLTGIPELAQDETPPPPQGGGQAAAPPAVSSIDIAKAIKFLTVNQNSDGTIGSSVLYSDWSALAFAAFGESEAAQKLRNFLVGAKYNTDFGSRTTDLERRAMALMALGVNPYNGTAVNFIAKIVSAFDDNQIGDPEIFNDDIFALFPLLKAGYTGSDEIVKKTISFVLSKQDANGSWGGADLTAAAIQALSLVLQNPAGLESQTIDLAKSALARAKNYLQNTQDSDGSFGGNSISTAWVSQAIVALGETVSSWQSHGKNPIDFMSSRQKIDGGFEDASVSPDTRIWTTAYVVPAALNKTWDAILKNFSKPSEAPTINGFSSNSATSTSEIPETAATSTPAEIFPLPNQPEENATSTPMVEQNLAVGEIISGVHDRENKIEAVGEEIKTSNQGQKGVVAQLNGKKLAETLNASPSASPTVETKMSPENQKRGIFAAVSDFSGGIAPKIFILSGGGALCLGLYLGLKFLIKFLGR